MRTTVTIDDDVYAKVKQIAQGSGHTFGQIISRLARKGLGAEPSFDPDSVVPAFRILVGRGYHSGKQIRGVA
jgi:predicted DNA-binding ribbon-helix-helix protein